jgi:predicted RNA-binding Zn ribbon-like protein
MTSHDNIEEQSKAPGQLELVRAFVNTLDVEDGIDDFTTPSGLAAWLADHELLGRGEKLAEADRERAVELREALREALLTHNGEPLPKRTVDRLNLALAGVTLGVRWGPDCTLELEPAGDGLDRAIARISEIVREATLSGEWERLKVCPADECLWAFYDRSRNRSRTWCSMGECGNRSKVRAFRARNTGR